ncbi:hypothetical protein [Bacillus sp. REN3]|uniref:hypothetical protein n=1 Tax=Bacillus sp. REN3 TaxID=2802440 RepID=UPI001AED8B41|nr:hypothetical protein [Bacillus sp. REN3]
MLDEAKRTGLLGDRLTRFAGRGLMLTVFALILIAYYLDSMSIFSMSVYSVIAGILLVRSWLKPSFSVPANGALGQEPQPGAAIQPGFHRKSLERQSMTRHRRGWHAFFPFIGRCPIHQGRHSFFQKAA